MSATQTVLVAFGLSLIALGIMARIAYLLQSDDEASVGLDIFFEPADRSDGLDSTDDDLLRWDVTQEGHALRNERLWAMPLEALQAEAEAKGIRGFEVMDRLQLIEALGGDAPTEELPRVDPEPTQELPAVPHRRITRSPLAKPIPTVERPLIRRPGVVTR